MTSEQGEDTRFFDNIVAGEPVSEDFVLEVEGQLCSPVQLEDRVVSYWGGGWW